MGEPSRLLHWLYSATDMRESLPYKEKEISVLAKKRLVKSVASYPGFNSKVKPCPIKTNDKDPEKRGCDHMIATIN